MNAQMTLKVIGSMNMRPHLQEILLAIQDHLDGRWPQTSYEQRVQNRFNALVNGSIRTTHCTCDGLWFEVISFNRGERVGKLPDQ